MKCVLTFIIILFVLTRPALATSSIVINEFQTSTPQQVELYNNGTEAVDISGWFIDDNGGTTFFTVPESTILWPNTCLSFASSFGFNTASADAVRLFNATAQPTATNAQIVDSFSYDKITDATTKNLQRIPDGSSIWVSSLPSIDHLNLNGVPCTPPPTPTVTSTPTRTPTPSKAPTPSPTNIPQTTYSSPSTYEKIAITEALPNPIAGQNEWVELYNGNDFTVSLESWYIDDVPDAGANPYKFFLTIPPHAYSAIDLPNAMFNNDGDTIRILDRNETQKDVISYQSISEAYTVNRSNTATSEVCLAPPSRGVLNNPCAPSTPVVDTASPSAALNTVPSWSTPNLSARAIYPLPASSAGPLSIKPATSLGGKRPTFSYNRAPNILSMRQLNPIINGMLITSIACSLLTIALVLFKMKLW
ncbi:lamin tail domain-containing protein [Candidatus Microgenomates bacterium]|nr:lamin tail domain-containing protein [Candidatus Microgenomates bacterium]